MSNFATTVYVEMTPNPNTMKFVANRIIVVDGDGAEFKSISETKGYSKLAEMLFAFPFIKSIYFNGNFVSITQNGKANWEDVNLEMREFITDYLKENELAVEKIPQQVTEENQQEGGVIPGGHALPTNEAEEKIIEVLDEYVRPAVENDGGMIEFRAYNEGVVTVAMKGACSGCPSSTATLKGGIETLLKQMVTGVTEVVALEE